MTYDDWQLYAPQIEAALLAHRGSGHAGDFAHFLWAMDREGRSIEWIVWDIAGRVGPEPLAVSTPEQEANHFPVPPSGIDLTSWSRRHGCSHAAGLLDSRWDYKAFAPLMAGIFGGKWQTRVNVLSASWHE